MPAGGLSDSKIARGPGIRPLALRVRGFTPPLRRLYSEMARPKLETPQVCPVCGEDVPRGSLACPACGADHNSGWRADADAHDALDLPDDDFDYDEFVRREFSPGAKPAGIKAVWWITAIILLALCLALYFFKS